MARKAKSTKTPAQRQAEMEALHEQLAAGVEELRSSERWAAYLRFCTSFHRYSFANTMLIWFQCPEASNVAGYRAWQAKGRQVRKGERGLRIIGTGTVRASKDSTEEEGEQTEDGRRRVFFPVSVFDISQTELAEGAEDVSTVAHELTGDDTAGILARVIEHLTSSGVPVEFTSTTGAINGYTTPANPETGEPVRVVISDKLDAAQQAKTALHEAAHIALGHLDDDHAEYLTHRGRYEVEAESVAYILAGILGADTSAYSFGYVAGWAETAESDVIKDTATRVLKAAHTLAEILAPSDEEKIAA